MQRANILNRAWHHQMFGHPQVTLRKAFWFGTTSGIGIVVVVGLTWTLTEWVGLHYMFSVIISSFVAYILKFLVNAIWIFNK